MNLARSSLCAPDSPILFQQHLPLRRSCCKRSHSSYRVGRLDVWKVATRRLENLLEDSRTAAPADIHDEVASYSPEARLTLATNLGSFLTLEAFVVCWLCGADPLGGMTLTDASLGAAKLGVLYALPLVLCSFLGRTRPVRQAFPVLADLHSSQRDLLAPWLEGMSASQLAVMVSFVVLPLVFTLLPAMKSGLEAMFTALVGHSFFSLPVPPELCEGAGVILPAVFSAFLAGEAVAGQLSVKHYEVHAIRDAAQSSERYFRLTMAMDEGMERNTACRSDESAAASHAFKVLSVAWLLERKRTCQLATILSMLNVTFFSLIWHGVGDLVAPAVAAMLHTGVEFAFVHHQLKAPSRR